MRKIIEALKLDDQSRKTVSYIYLFISFSGQQECVFVEDCFISINENTLHLSNKFKWEKNSLVFTKESNLQSA